MPMAPLPVGAACLYDYRVVHAGSPNDWHAKAAGEPSGGGADEGLGGDRPILQLTYFRHGYRERYRNYGWHEVLP